MKTKLLTLLLCLLTTLPALAYALPDFQVDNIYYKITGDNTVEVTKGNNGSYSGSITIPAEVQYDGKTYSVTSIGEQAFWNCTGLTSITLPNSITAIGKYAFEGCTGLTSITLPNSLTSIGNYAFAGCTGLTSITLPNSLTSIGIQAFSDCTGLTSITLPNSLTSIGNNAFYNCTGLTSITLPNSLTSIGNWAFYNCRSLTSITLPNSLTSIGTWAFYNCRSLTSITLPNSLTSIGTQAFYNCTGLTSITLPNSLTSIGNNAFYNCTGLTSITLPNSLTSIGDGAFASCSSLTQIEVDNANKAYCSIDGVLFNKDKTTIITYPAGKSNSNQYIIPNSVTSIGNYAFYNCRSLTSITLPNSLTSIGYYAFYYCTGLTSITLPNSLTSIGYCAFYFCTGLTSITLPNSLTSIGIQAFSDCTGLTSITLPNSLTSIGQYAFFGCRSLTEIYCEAEVPPTFDYDVSLPDVVYANCTLYVPVGAVEAYRHTAPWNKFVNIVGVDNNEVEEPEEPTWQTAVTIEEEAKQWLFVPYVWASSDEAVASVSQTGEVTAVAPGTCTVTFTCGDLVYSCVVTVINKSTGRAEVSSMSPAVAYDLQGRRVSNPRRGIFIVNGQKQRLN